MVVADFFRVSGALQKLWNRVHRAGTVQRNNGGDILNAAGLQPHAYARHSGGFHLEDAGGSSGGEHFIGLRISLRHIFQTEAWLLFLKNFYRVIQNRQIPETQKVHFQKSQFL